MSFNPDSLKQPQEVNFTREVENLVHPPIFFNDKQVQQVSYKKYIWSYTYGLILDTCLTFDKHIKPITPKVIKTM